MELQEEVRHIFHFWIADTLQGKQIIISLFLNMRRHSMAGIFLIIE